MLGRARTALKFLTYGILLGAFFAPRSGAESREQAMSWVSDTARELIETARGLTAEH